MSYKSIHDLIHLLEKEIALTANASTNSREQQALEYAKDNLVHQVAEYIRTAEKQSENPNWPLK